VEVELEADVVKTRYDEEGTSDSRQKRNRMENGI